MDHLQVTVMSQLNSRIPAVALFLADALPQWGTSTLYFMASCSLFPDFALISTHSCSRTKDQLTSHTHNALLWYLKYCLSPPSLLVHEFVVVSC